MCNMQVSNVKSGHTHSYYWAVKHFVQVINILSTQQSSVVHFSNRTTNECIIIIIRHMLGLNRLFWSRIIVYLEVFQFVFIWLMIQHHFSILFLFILIICCSQFDLYLLSFLSTGWNFSSSKSSFLLWSKSVYPIVLLKNFITIDVSCSLFIWLSVQILIPYTRMWAAGALQLIFGDFWTKVGLKLLFKTPSIWENVYSICWNLFQFHRIFHNCIYKILYKCYPQWCNNLLGLVLKMPSSQIFLVIFPLQKSFAVFYNLNIFTPVCKLSLVSYFDVILCKTKCLFM